MGKISSGSSSNHQKQFDVQENPKQLRTIYRHVKPIWRYWGRASENGNIGTFWPRDLNIFPPIDLGWRSAPLVGSLLNVKHKVRGSTTKIYHQKLHWNANSKVGSLDNVSYNKFRHDNDVLLPEKDPVYHDRCIVSTTEPKSIKLKNYDHIKAKIQSMDNIEYSSGGERTRHYPCVKMFHEPAVGSPKNFEHIEPKVGSLTNIGHTPGGGNIKLLHHTSLKWTQKPKVSSLENIHHCPKGGNVRIESQKLNWNAKSKVGSLENIHYKPRPFVTKMIHFNRAWLGTSKVGSLDNFGHVAGTRLRWKLGWTAKSGVYCLPYENHPV